MTEKATRAQQKQIRQIANKVFGDDRALVREWMQRRVPALGGARPVDLKKTREGAEQVHRVLECIYYGVYL